ncbi:hypothetical protein GJAV_G00087400 [Gymnothorax javanicus]|nr:hypothetical protein GJAV_G00087400 [Gymnothorax javanicus]
MNDYMLTRTIPKIWRKTKIIAFLKPGKDPAYSKSFRPISLLCHLYKLFERLILNRLSPVVEPAIIPQQAGFQSGKSTTSQLLNLAQHIEGEFQKGLVTGVVFVDLSAAFDTVNHRLLLKKILENTKDLALTDLIGALLKDRRFYVVLNNKQSRWRRQQNGLHQGSVLAPLLYNIYTNDQPMDQNTERFIYANNLCVTVQENYREDLEAATAEPQRPKDLLLQLISLQKATGSWDLVADLVEVLGKTEEEVAKHKPPKVDGSSLGNSSGSAVALRLS